MCPREMAAACRKLLNHGRGEPRSGRFSFDPVRPALYSIARFSAAPLRHLIPRIFNSSFTRMSLASRVNQLFRIEEELGDNAIYGGKMR